MWPYFLINLCCKHFLYVFVKKKQNNFKKRKKSHLAGVEPESFDLKGQRIIHCATQPLLKLHVKLIVFNIFVPTK